MYQDRHVLYQNQAVLVLLVMVYVVFITSSLSVMYQQVRNRSSVTFYADPREEQLTIDDHRLDTFLDMFNRAPKQHHLQVSGFVKTPQAWESMVAGPGITEWNGESYMLAFSFALDLANWIARGDGADHGHVPANRHGVSSDGLRQLHRFLRAEGNSLACVELRKDIDWPQWEDLATNIKLRIKQSGFNGLVTVHRPSFETLHVHKNTHWANFMHNRVTKALLALTIVGWLFYLVYMWLRCTKLVVSTRHRVDIDISRYWAFIDYELGERGFRADDPTVRASSRRPEVRSMGGGMSVAITV